MDNNYVIGIDFGTDSVRAVLINAQNGYEVGSAVNYYSRWREGKYCDPSKFQFRQHISDHLESMEAVVKDIVTKSKVPNNQIKGICIDTTGSSPVPVDEKGIALCLKPGFEDDPDAMMVLWKDHTAIKEAEEINDLARSWGGVDYTQYEGGVYSSEWFWAKILHIVRSNDKVRDAAFSWMEHCDLMTFILTGKTDLKSFKRSRCAAGHKAMWHKSWNGLPDASFLIELDPSFVQLRKNLYEDTYTSDQTAGNLSKVWADKFSLSNETVVAVGTFDAHAGAVGAQVGEHTLIKVMGTSTCDILVATEEVIGTDTVKGICGQVNGSVIPGMVGLEAGQSAFGDFLAWFRDVLAWPIENLISLSDSEKVDIKNSILDKLSLEAEKIPVSKSLPIALDWINGRRTPYANQALKAALINLNLGTKAPEIFKAIVESICFGSLKIVERFREQGVRIDEVIGVGGVAKKSPFVMQTLADILEMPIKVAKSEQTPALGAAMFAAVASGIYPDVHKAINAMGSGFDITYYPDKNRAELYKEMYQTYNTLGSFIESKI